jgi:hypothetical protein
MLCTFPRGLRRPSLLQEAPTILQNSTQQYITVPQDISDIRGAAYIARQNIIMLYRRYIADGHHIVLRLSPTLDKM